MKKATFVLFALIVLATGCSSSREAIHGKWVNYKEKEEVSEKAGGYLNEAGVYLDQEEYKKAIEKLNQAILESPNFVTAHFMRGITYFLEEENETAVVDFTSVIALDPNFAGAYLHRGFSYYKLGKDVLAIEDFKKCLELSKDKNMRKLAKDAITWRIEKKQKK